MRIFVTGGTGFIGSHFINQAHAAGHEVLALRRSTSSKPRFLLEREPKWIEGPIGFRRTSQWQGVDVLIHLAANGITPQPATWEDCYQVNVLNTLAMVKSAVEAGVRRVVVTGTYAEYGKAGLRFDPIPPDAPLEPTDPYAASKASSSVALAAMCLAMSFELAYLRVFSVYGEGQFEKNFWPQLSTAAQSGQDFPMTHGNQIRDFVPVDFAAKHILQMALDEHLFPGEPLIRNLGTGKPQSLRNFAQFWWEKWGATGELKIGALTQRQNEVMRYVPLVTGL
jgi:UDP-glucose 4-epimerase